MNKIIDYGVESSNALKNFVERVNKKISEGWQLEEGCTLGTDKLENREFNQVIVKYSKPVEHRIVEYCIIYNIGMSHLVDRVREKISKGWQPVGSCISIRDDSGKNECYQTMVMYEGNESKPDAVEDGE